MDETSVKHWFPVPCYQTPVPFNLVTATSFVRYVPMKTCLHPVPSAIEQHGTEWPEEWPKRLETYPDWMNNKEKLVADTNYWKAIVEKSYLTGMGIDWSNIRNIMDMKAINGGYAN